MWWKGYSRSMACLNNEQVRRSFEDVVEGLLEIDGMFDCDNTFEVNFK
jgi:hypothetical protein